MAEQQKPSAPATTNDLKSKGSGTELVVKAQKQLKASGKFYDDKFVKRADRMANMYQVNHYFDEQTGKQTKADRDRVKVAYPYSNVRQIVAEIYTGLPEAIVKSETKRPQAAPQPQVPGMPQAPQAEPQDGAQTLKRALDYVKRKSNMEKEASRMVLDGVALGIGCIQLCAQRTTKVPKYVRKTYREVVYDAANVTDIYESDWIACKLVRELEEIKADDSYDEAHRQNVSPAKLDEMLYGTSEIQYGVLWEFFDKKRDFYLVFPDDQQLPLVNKKLSEMYKFNVVSDDFQTDWPFTFFINEPEILTGNGMGDIYPIESSVRELDKTRTQQINHRKRFNRKYLVKKGALDAQGINQLKNPDDGTIINHNSNNPTVDIMPLVDAPMSSDVYRVEDAIQRDIQIIGPLGPNSLVHGVGAQPDTLGQSQIVEQSSNTRLADKQKNLARAFSRLYRLTAEFIQQYWVETEDLLVSGDGSKDEDWLTFDPALIQGEFDYDVVPESMKDNSVVYRKQAGDALAIVTPLIPVAKEEPSVAIMVRKYLDTFDTFKKDIDKIVPVEWTQDKPPAEPMPPQDVPNVSVNLRDFPIPVQIKGLALAGIDVTEADFQVGTLGAPAEGAGDGTGDPMQELQALIASGDEASVIDTVRNLPQNEQQAITEAIGRMRGTPAPTQIQQPAPAAA